MALIEPVLRPAELTGRERARYERARFEVDRRVEPVAVLFLSDSTVQLFYDEDASYVLTFDEQTGRVTESMQDPTSDERRTVVREYERGWFGRDERDEVGDLERG